MKTRAGSGVQLHSRLTLALDRSGQSHDPAFSRPLKEPQYKSNRRLRGPQLILTFGEEINVLPPPGLESEAIQLIASSLAPAPLSPERISCIMHSARYIHLTLLVLISHTIYGVECISQWSSLCRSLQLPLTSSALGPDVLHSAQFSNTQVMFLHLTASGAAFGATAPESKWVIWFIEKKTDLHLQHNFCDIWTFKSSGMLYGTMSPGRYHVQGGWEILRVFRMQAAPSWSAWPSCSFMVLWNVGRELPAVTTRRGRGGNGTIYRGPAVGKGVRDPTISHMLVSFSNSLDQAQVVLQLTVFPINF